jgi:hypothetical protein
MEAMVVSDTLDSLAFHDTPVAPRYLAHGRPHHSADVAGDVDAGSRPLSDLPVSDPVCPQSLYPHGDGSPLGIMARRAAPLGAEVLLHQWPLPTPYFH